MSVATALAAMLLLAWPAPSRAVIKVEFPVSKIYEASRAVAVGTVVRVNPDNRVVEVKVTGAMKGEAGGDQVRIQLVEPAALIKQVAAGGPVVLFVGETENKPMAVVHLADTWLLAEGIPGRTPPAWRVGQVYDGAKSFPGRTVALAQIVADLKAGRPGVQNAVDDEVFQRGVRELANLKLKPTFLTALDVNADGKLDLIVGTRGGAGDGANPAGEAGRVRLFIATPNGYTDATEAWGLAGATAARCVAGDINGDGKPDLLLGGTLWLREGDKFARSRTKATLDLPPESDWLAATLADATGDKRPDAVVLTKSGKLFTLENPGSTDKPWPSASRALWEGGEAPAVAVFSTEWGDDGALHVLAVRTDGITRYAADAKGAPPADFLRLTGTSLAACNGLADKRLKVLMATPLDCDGNGRLDLLVVTETGGLALMNRGYGVFLANDTIGPVFHPAGGKPLPFKLNAAAVVAPGQVQPGKTPRQNLLVLTEDGGLFEMDNSVQRD